LEGVTITRKPGSAVKAVTGADGRYRLRARSGLVLTLTASHGSERIEREGVEAGAQGVDFIFGLTGGVHYGKALFHFVGEGGETLSAAGLRAAVRPEGDADFRTAHLVPQHRLAWKELDAEEVKKEMRLDRSGEREGLYALLGRTGPASVRFFGGDHQSEELSGVRFSTEKRPLPHRVRLRPGASLQLTLRGERSLGPPSRVSVFLFAEHELERIGAPFRSYELGDDRTLHLEDPGLLRRKLRFQGDGSARAKGLTPGRHVLFAVPDEIVFEPPMIEVGAGEGSCDVRWSSRAADPTAAKKSE